MFQYYLKPFFLFSLFSFCPKISKKKTFYFIFCKFIAKLSIPKLLCRNYLCVCIKLKQMLARTKTHTHTLIAQFIFFIALRFLYIYVYIFFFGLSLTPYASKKKALPCVCFFLLSLFFAPCAKAK